MKLSLVIPARLLEEASQEPIVVEETLDESPAVLDDMLLAYVGGGTGIGNMQ